MRRKLGNTDQLQENKVINLSLATPKVSGILIKPGETFSFWHLVGAYSAKHGYREGLTISFDKATKGVGGDMCQFTNLIHWMILHTPLIITEHHHHEGIDLFPDFGKQVPFGTGTSVMYNYLNYRFKNITEQPYQLVVYTDEQYLYGKIRTTKPLSIKYHIKPEGEGFVKEGEDIFRYCIDKRTGTILKKELIKENHAKVMYPISL